MPKIRPNGGVIGPTNTANASVASGVYSVVEAQLDKQAGAFPQYAGVDAQFNLTTLLLHGDGSNGANNNTFLDSSTNALAITRNGTPTQGTFSPFSQTGWSNYFNGSTDYITASSASAFAYGTNNFTVEGWIYPQSLPSSGTYGGIFICNSPTDIYGFGLYLYSDGKYYLLIQNVAGSSWTTVGYSSTAITVGTWNHVALVRNGNVFTLYSNGVSVATTTSSANLTNTNNLLTIGARPGTSQYFNGYISNVRSVNGTAVYTGAFTPPTAPLTAITNTQLLTCQSNRFVDTSASPLTIATSGTPSVQPFSPFLPSIAYGVSTVGGSIYFDGSSYLSGTFASPVTLGTQDFTYEAWAYFTNFNYGSYGCPLISLYGNSGAAQFMLRAGKTAGSSTNMNAFFYNSGSYYPSGAGSSGYNFGTVYLNQWQHIAVTRASGVWNMYIDGVRIASVSDSSNLSTSASNFYIGNDHGSGDGYMGGYISGARFLLGTAVYSGATYTRPTAPFSNVTNTQFLLNGTNAGVYDSTAKNNFLTGSTATISTTQAKFGSGSMYFDATANAAIRNDVNSSGAVTFGTGDFTVECWFYPSTNTGSFTTLITSRTVTTTNSFWLGMSGLTPIYYRDVAVITSGSAVTLNNWHHIALCRSSGTTRLFVDGVSVGTPVSDTTNFTDVDIRLGYDTSQSAFGFSGYMDDVRISKYARYPTNSTFTPSIIAWLNQ